MSIFVGGEVFRLERPSLQCFAAVIRDLLLVSTQACLWPIILCTGLDSEQENPRHSWRRSFSATRLNMLTNDSQSYQ